MHTQDNLGVRKTHTLTQDDLGVRKTHTLTQDDLGVRKTHTLTQDDLGVRKTHTLKHATQDDPGVRKTHTLTYAHTRWPRSQKTPQKTHSAATPVNITFVSTSISKSRKKSFDAYFKKMVFVVVVSVVARSWHFFQHIHNYVTHFKSLWVL